MIIHLDYFAVWLGILGHSVGGGCIRWPLPLSRVSGQGWVCRGVRVRWFCQGTDSSRNPEQQLRQIAKACLNLPIWKITVDNRSRMRDRFFVATLVDGYVFCVCFYFCMGIFCMSLGSVKLCKLALRSSLISARLHNIAHICMIKCCSFG